MARGAKRGGEFLRRAEHSCGRTFCTDGLVETRHRSFDQGISVLCAELDRVGDSPLDATVDRLIQSLAADPEDDVTQILARIPEDDSGPLG